MSFEESTSADSSSIGFEYQDYYTLLLLLQLEPGCQLGIEVKDDIHIEDAEGIVHLYQAKHSVQTTASGQPINIPTLDSDLWKTIYNWSSMISDSTTGRSTTDSQLEYIRKTRFYLLTNKAINNNKFRESLENYSTNKDEALLHSSLNAIKASTTDLQIISYIDKLLSLEIIVISSFIAHVSFLPEEDELIDKIKKEIRKSRVADHRIDDIFAELLANFKGYKYQTIKSRDKVIITYDNFHRMSRPCFEKGRLVKLIRRELEELSPKGGELFAQQIQDLGFAQEDLIEYDQHRLLADMNLERWIQEGSITETDKDSFFRNAILTWRPLFQQTHITTELQPYASQFINAKQCFFNTQRLTLAINQQQLDADIANGTFYVLADIPRIGWVFNWVEKYQK